MKGKGDGRAKPKHVPVVAVVVVIAAAIVFLFSNASDAGITGQAVLDNEGIVLHKKFNDVRTQIIVNAETRVDSIQGNVMELNGDGYMEIPDSNALDFKDGLFTMSAWIKTTASKSQIIMEKSSAGVSGWTNNYGMWINTDGKLNAFAHCGRPFDVGDLTSTTKVNDGKWHHVAFVRNGSNNARILYVDGNFENFITEPDSQKGCDDFSTDTPLYLGARKTPPTADGTLFFDGSIDEVVLLNKAIGRYQVTRLMEETRGNTLPAPVQCESDAQCPDKNPSPECSGDQLCGGGQQGSCSDGTCNYIGDPVCQPCEFGCSNGTCNIETPQTQVCSELIDNWGALGEEIEGYTKSGSSSWPTITTADFGGPATGYNTVYLDPSGSKNSFVAFVVVLDDSSLLIAKEGTWLEDIKRNNLWEGRITSVSRSNFQNYYTLVRNDRRELFWTNRNVLVQIVFFEGDSPIVNPADEILNFVRSIGDNDFAEVIPSDEISNLLDGVARHYLRSCESTSNEVCWPRYSYKVEPAICPEYGEQVERLVDTNRCSLEEKKTISCSPGVCSGCLTNAGGLSDSRCIPYGIRIEGDGGENQYCEIDGELKEQKALDPDGSWARCQNNYECRSNLCSDGECIQISGAIRQVSGLRDFFVSALCLLVNPFSSSDRAQCISDALSG